MLAPYLLSAGRVSVTRVLQLPCRVRAMLQQQYACSVCHRIANMVPVST